MKRTLQGWGLAIQFFSIIPLKREIPMGEKQLQGAVFALPWLGSLLGGLSLIVSYLLITYTPMTAGSVAIMIVFVHACSTGGIHLDGWMDSSDAYFSYQSKERRLEIMDDPRTGAFGVLSVFGLLVLRFTFVKETLLLSTSMLGFGLVVIPFLTRLLLPIHFTWTPLAKQKGLSHLFASACNRSTLLASLWSLVIVCGGVTAVDPSLIYVWAVMIAFTFLFYVTVRLLSIKAFGGMTGDVLGATVEGGETFLWIVLWMCILFGMG